MSTKLSSYLCIRCAVWSGWAVIYGGSAAFTVSRTTAITHPDMPPITAFWSKCPSRALVLNRINTWDYLESPDSLYLGLFNLCLPPPTPPRLDGLILTSFRSKRAVSECEYVNPCVSVDVCACVSVESEAWISLSETSLHSLKHMNANQMYPVVLSAVSRPISDETIILVWACFVSGSNFSHRELHSAKTPTDL